MNREFKRDSYFRNSDGAGFNKTLGSFTENESKSVTDDDVYTFEHIPHVYESSFRGNRPNLFTEERYFEKNKAIGQTSKSLSPESFSKPISALNFQQQEIALLEDLFNILLGFQGNYIKIRKSYHKEFIYGYQFYGYAAKISTDVDRSLKEISSKISKIAENYMNTKEFVLLYSKPNSGQVNQALCAAIKTLEREYMEQIVDLEDIYRNSKISSPFTLRDLWCQLAVRAEIMERLVLLIISIYVESDKIETEIQLRDQELGLATAADQNSDENLQTSAEEYSDEDSNNGDTDSYDDNESYLDEENQDMYESSPNTTSTIKVKGGATLNAISQLMLRSSGDQISSDVYSYLLSCAAEPFLKLLRQWLHFGIVEKGASIESGQNEFMIFHSEGQPIAAMAGSDDILVINNKNSDNNSSPTVLKFSINLDMTPDFLLKWSKKILLTGKYINVVRECGAVYKAVKSDFGVSKDGDIHHTVETSAMMKALNGRLLVKEIEVTYQHANTELLGVLLKDNYLQKYLNAVKRYLLLDQSDFLTNFFDSSESNLERLASEDMGAKLQLILENTLRNPASTTYHDPYKDKISLSFANEKLIDALSILQSSATSNVRTQQPNFNEINTVNFGQNGSLANENANRNSTQKNSELDQTIHNQTSLTCNKVLCFTLEPDFPASIIFNTISIRKYSLLHRHILGLKYLEWKLTSNWMNHSKSFFYLFKNSKISNSQSSSINSNFGDTDTNSRLELNSLRRKVHLILFSIRNRMLVFVQQVLYYLFFEVFEPNWKQLIALISKAKTVDNLLDAHGQFLDSSLLQCGLTNPKLFKNINRLISMCNYLVSNTQELCDSNSFLNLENKNTPTESISIDKRESQTVPDQFGASSSVQTQFGFGGANKTDTSNSGRVSDFNVQARLGLGTVQSLENSDTAYNKLSANLKMLKYVSNSFSSTINVMMEALNHYAQSQSPRYLNLATRLEFIKHEEN
ncbi:hypothetical protein BB558_001104 [Smittium angustum]|uniref:Spindle pole body component n=1 Tax=Smittium angustum TaxID=133377 RepID=A0A2U1JCB5_SMIAN|nr:hypothetical protein BB558_001104 [Smittium angustum]